MCIRDSKIPAFRVVSVFDISQTEGKELPALTYELTGNVEPVSYTHLDVYKRQALYYGLNALSNNMILCDRKQLKNPNGLILDVYKRQA